MAAARLVGKIIPNINYMLLFLTKKHYFLIIAIVLIIALAVLFYFLGRRAGQELEVSPLPLEQRLNQPVYSPERLSSGQVGEIESALQKPGFANHIFSTAGPILETGQDYMVITGDGSNFADGQARELRCRFADTTLTFDQAGEKYQGIVGLAVLKPDMMVLVGGAENIRGKTEFELKTVNIIK